MNKKRKTIGLALGSGGIRGLAHVGVIKKLAEHHIPIDFIAGSSIGSWVGAHFALFQDLELLEEITVGRQKEKFYAFIEPTIDGGLIKGTKMEKLIDTWLLGKNFEDTKIPFCAVATDLISGNSIVLNTDKLAPALRASMSIPTLFAPFAYKNYLLVDGGISQPVPDEVVKQMGADIVISVNLDNYIKNDNFAVEKQNSLRYVATRSINVIRYHLSKYSTTHSDIIIEPYTPTVGASSFRDYFAQKIAGTKLVENGEIETEKVIEKIKELMSD